MSTLKHFPPQTLPIGKYFRLVIKDNEEYQFEERGMFRWWKWKPFLKWKMVNGKPVFIK